MEQRSSPAMIQPFLSSSILGDILEFEVICMWVAIIQRFLSRSISFLRSQFSFCCSLELWPERKSQDFEVPLSRPLSQNVKVDDGSLRGEEIEAVMERLEIFCNLEGEKLRESLRPDEVSGLFEEKEPSLEELNEAFFLYDVNRDGLIDASELQRVLRLLGFRQGTGIEDCQKMISTYDENGDGRIDFYEFVKFTEKCLS